MIPIIGIPQPIGSTLVGRLLCRLGSSVRGVAHCAKWRYHLARVVQRQVVCIVGLQGCLPSLLNKVQSPTMCVGLSASNRQVIHLERVYSSHVGFSPYGGTFKS
jgi:hypothetical protein